MYEAIQDAGINIQWLMGQCEWSPWLPSAASQVSWAETN